jgi:nitrite reductase/ring-hydroxylating ferredoxin subunit
MSSSSERWHSFPAAGLVAGNRMVVEVDGREILVLRTDRGLVAVDNECPHEGNPLVEGDLLGPTLVCAYHGWRFDLETGACLLGERPVRRYAAEERDGEVWIRA